MKQSKIKMFAGAVVALVGSALGAAVNEADIVFPADTASIITVDEIKEGWRTGMFQGSLNNADPETGWTRTTAHGGKGYWHFDSASNVLTTAQADQPAVGPNAFSGAVNGKGGVVATNKRYRNVEVRFDMKLNWGNDGGIFFRMKGKSAYQVVLDYYQGGALGQLWMEQLSNASKNGWAYQFSASRTASKNTNWFNSNDWSKFWREGQWNDIRLSVKGDNPQIKTWVNGIQIGQFTPPVDEAGDELDADYRGRIGIQVHNGGGSWGGATAKNIYRNIRIRELADQAPYAAINRCEDTSGGDADGKCDELIPEEPQDTAAVIFVGSKNIQNFSPSNLILESKHEITVQTLNGKTVYYNQGEQQKYNLLAITDNGTYIATVTNKEGTFVSKFTNLK